MNSNFRELISGHSFDRQLDDYFSDLSSSEVDYLYSYSQPCDNACLRIEFDNCKNMSRLTLWESGECTIEVRSFKNSATLLSETSQLTSLGEFEDKLLSLKEHMKATQQLH